MPAQELIEQGERRRDEIEQFIADYVGENGYSPTIAEIGKAVGVSSPNAVRNHLTKMEESGRIKTTPRIARSIVLTPDE